MTGHEARQKLLDAGVCDYAQASYEVSVLVALGLLTLTDLRSTASRLDDELRHTKNDFLEVWHAIDKAGLKLVDK